jgi:hypothetical protein
MGIASLIKRNVRRVSVTDLPIILTEQLYAQELWWPWEVLTLLTDKFKISRPQ